MTPRVFDPDTSPKSFGDLARRFKQYVSRYPDHFTLLLVAFVLLAFMVFGGSTAWIVATGAAFVVGLLGTFVAFLLSRRQYESEVAWRVVTGLVAGSGVHVLFGAFGLFVAVLFG